MGIFFENEYTSNKEHNYGVPELKDFPLDTNEDIQKAIKDFHKCPKKYKEELTINIIRRLMQLDNTATPMNTDDKEGEFYRNYKAKKSQYDVIKSNIEKCKNQYE